MDKYIDAELYKEELRSRQNRPDAQHLSFYLGVQMAIDLVDRVPEVELAPVVHSHWKEYVDYSGAIYPECAHCGLVWWLDEGTAEENEMYYCPKCGAIMDEEVETDESTQKVISQA